MTPLTQHVSIIKRSRHPARAKVERVASYRTTPARLLSFSLVFGGSSPASAWFSCWWWSGMWCGVGAR